MKPDKPPEEDLKPERIQDAIREVSRSFLDRLYKALHWIDVTVGRLLSIFRPGGDDPS